jgi:hypothetical protein
MMYKRRALDLIHSRVSGKNKKGGGVPTDETADAQDDSPAAAAASDAAVPAEGGDGGADGDGRERGPFVSSLGRPGKRRSKVTSKGSTSDAGMDAGRLHSAESAAAESMEVVKRRVRTESLNAETTEGWDIARVIAKSNDDLRQEVFIMQLISLM